MAVVLGRKGGGGGGGGGAPTGAAGGSLGGTYPNPSLSAAKQAELDGKVPKSLYDANTVLAANADDTPLALTMGASTILARLAAGNIKAASVAEIKTLLGIGSVFDSTLGGAATTIDTGAAGIPGGFSVLEVFCVLRTDGATAAANPIIRFNNVSTTTYGRQLIRGQNVTPAAAVTTGDTGLSMSAHGNGGTAGMATMFSLIVHAYADTTFSKTGILSVATPDLTAGNNVIEMWQVYATPTTAISRVAIIAAGAENLMAGSRMTCYVR